MVQYITAQDSDVRINDHILSSKSPLDENQVELRHLRHSPFAIKALKFVTGVWVNL